MELTVTGGNALQVSDQVFARDFNEGLVHQVVTAYMAGGRQGTKAQKNRAAVSGGGAKPWRQKGTGRARAGTIRSPIWRSGGVTFAAQPRDYSQKVNRKMVKAALSTILSELVRQERLIVVDSFSQSAPKTRELLAQLKTWSIENEKVLIVLAGADANIELSARNLSKVAICDANQIDPVGLVAYEKIVMTVDALKKIEEKLA